MMTASTDDLRTSEPRAGGNPRGTLLALRIVAVLVTLIGFAQPVLAGLFIGGTADVVFIHGMVGESVWAFALIQLIIAIVYVWKGRGRMLALYAAIGLLLSAYVTSMLGWMGVVAVHIPLAVAVIAAQLVFTLWTFHGSAGEGRALKA